MTNMAELTLGALLVVAVAVLGVAGTLSSSETSTLLGTLAGYVFGRQVNKP